MNVTHFPNTYMNIIFFIEWTTLCSCVIISYSQDIWSERNMEEYRDTMPVSGLVFMLDGMKVYKLFFIFVISDFRRFVNSY